MYDRASDNKFMLAIFKINKNLKELSYEIIIKNLFVSVLFQISKKIYVPKYVV